MPIVGSVQYERAWASPILVRQWLRMYVCVLSYVYNYTGPVLYTIIMYFPGIYVPPIANSYP